MTEIILNIINFISLPIVVYCIILILIDKGKIPEYITLNLYQLIIIGIVLLIVLWLTLISIF